MKIRNQLFSVFLLFGFFITYNISVMSSSDPKNRDSDFSNMSPRLSGLSNEQESLHEIPKTPRPTSTPILIPPPPNEIHIDIMISAIVLLLIIIFFGIIINYKKLL